MVTDEWDRDEPRYDFDLATLSRENYLWNFWEQPIPTKTFCGQAADVHVMLIKARGLAGGANWELIAAIPGRPINC